MATHFPSVETAYGFIVFDLETDGLITNTIFGGASAIPQILQIGFAPLEKLAHPMNVVSFYTQPIDPVAFHQNLKQIQILQKLYIEYRDGHFYVKTPGGSQTSKVEAITLKDAIDKFIEWKRKMYRDRQVFFIAHNGIKFDKVVLEHNLSKLNLLDHFQGKINLVGWVDSLQVIRELPNIIQVLGYTFPKELSVLDRMSQVMRLKPFGLGNLIQALSKRYSELTKAQNKLEWPIFKLSLLERSEESDEWLHYFTKEAMIHSYRSLVKKLTLHRSSDDVMALVCILHLLNLYPTFKQMAA